MTRIQRVVRVSSARRILYRVNIQNKLRFTALSLGVRNEKARQEFSLLLKSQTTQSRLIICSNLSSYSTSFKQTELDEAFISRIINEINSAAAAGERRAAVLLIDCVERREMARFNCFCWSPLSIESF